MNRLLCCANNRETSFDDQLMFNHATSIPFGERSLLINVGCDFGVGLESYPTHPQQYSFPNINSLPCGILREQYPRVGCSFDEMKALSPKSCDDFISPFRNSSHDTILATFKLSLPNSACFVPIFPTFCWDPTSRQPISRKSSLYIKKLKSNFEQFLILLTSGVTFIQCLSATETRVISMKLAKPSEHDGQLVIVLSTETDEMIEWPLAEMDVIDLMRVTIRKAVTSPNPSLESSEENCNIKSGSHESSSHLISQHHSSGEWIDEWCDEVPYSRHPSLSAHFEVLHESSVPKKAFASSKLENWSESNFCSQKLVPLLHEKQQMILNSSLFKNSFSDEMENEYINNYQMPFCYTFSAYRTEFIKTLKHKILYFFSPGNPSHISEIDPDTSYDDQMFESTILDSNNERLNEAIANVALELMNEKIENSQGAHLPNLGFPCSKNYSSVRDVIFNKAHHTNDDFYGNSEIKKLIRGIRHKSTHPKSEFSSGSSSSLSNGSITLHDETSDNDSQTDSSAHLISQHHLSSKPVTYSIECAALVIRGTDDRSMQLVILFDSRPEAEFYLSAFRILCEKSRELQRGISQF